MSIADLKDQYKVFKEDLPQMRPRILVVDVDSAITRQLLWTLSDDYDVMIANDMHTAVRHATIHEPAVSILDLPSEPRSSDIGLRILEYIKAHIPSSKVLVMTAAGGIQTLKNCYGIGADEFLCKPFDTEQLRSAMRRMAPRSLDLA